MNRNTKDKYIISEYYHFNADVNLIREAEETNTQVIMSGSYKLVGSDESVSFIEEFLENVGKRGGNTEWFTLLEMIFKYQLVYGRSFTEIIYNVEGNQIMDLDFIDPKSKELIWRGWAKGVVGNEKTPEERQKKIEKTVQKILEKYPPHPQ